MEYRKLPHGSEQISVIGFGLSAIKRSVDWQLTSLKTDYIDFGFLHCIDEENDLQNALEGGILDYILRLKKEGVVRHIGLSSHTPQDAEGVCVYCNHCQPCPMGLDVGLINKYYDLSLAGDTLAKSHYANLGKKAADCIGCGHCGAVRSMYGRQRGCRRFRRILADRSQNL